MEPFQISRTLQNDLPDGIRLLDYLLCLQMNESSNSICPSAKKFFFFTSSFKIGQNLFQSGFMPQAQVPIINCEPNFNHAKRNLVFEVNSIASILLWSFQFQAISVAKYLQFLEQSERFSLFSSTCIIIENLVPTNFSLG